MKTFRLQYNPGEESGFQHRELEHLLAREQRSAVQPEGSSMNRTHIYCSGSWLFCLSYNMSDHQKIILAALSVTLWHFFPSHFFFFFVEGHISVTSQVTGCGKKSSLASSYCRNYGQAISHFKAEQQYSRSSTGCAKHQHSPEAMWTYWNSCFVFWQGNKSPSDDLFTLRVYVASGFFDWVASKMVEKCYFNPHPMYLVKYLLATVSYCHYIFFSMWFLSLKTFSAFVLRLEIDIASPGPSLSYLLCPCQALCRGMMQFHNATTL